VPEAQATSVGEGTWSVVGHDDDALELLRNRIDLRHAKGAVMAEWYRNIHTGKIEEGKQSLSSEVDGPYATREDAARAPEIAAERSRKWAEDDAKND